MPSAVLSISVNPVLAALPVEDGHISVFKVLLYIAATILWAQNTAWTDQDTLRVRTRKGPWILAVFGAGSLALIVWLLVPMFWIGLGLFVLLYSPAILSYVVFRNARVSPTQTVLTMAHLKRITSPRPETEDVVHAQDRVRLRDSKGKAPAWPTDPQLRAGYEAVQDLIFDSIWRRASDVRLDLIPQQQVKITYKVDGVERSRDPVEPQLGALMFGQLKQIAGMNPQEHRRPQMGRFVAAIGPAGKGERKVDVELKASGSTAGQRILYKLFAEESKFRLSDIGLTKEQLELFERVVKTKSGVMLITGERESGITSTMYAVVRAHDAFMQNIHTLEVNKAMELENVTQNIYDPKDAAIPYSKRFQSMIRTDPDVALAIDVPDQETCRIAATHAKQGKKVYLGFQAKDTLAGLRKYARDVGDVGLAASSLMAISSQRLLRKLCTNCRRAYRPDPALLKKANLPLGENRPFYRPPNPNEVEVDKQGNPVVCPVCQGSGYHGRTGIFEIMVVDDAVRPLIASGKSLTAIRSEARKNGMLYLQEVALRKVYDGLTSINEVLRVTQDTVQPPADAGTPAAT